MGRRAMKIDLTKIETPFMLLDAETQAALKAHGGPYQLLTDEGWTDWEDPAWVNSSTYRVKPAPPKPREWWCVGKHMHDSEAGAIAFRDECRAKYVESDFGPIIHVIEVLK